MSNTFHVVYSLPINSLSFVVGWLISWKVGWSVDRLVRWSVHHLSGCNNNNNFLKRKGSHLYRYDYQTVKTVIIMYFRIRKETIIMTNKDGHAAFIDRGVASLFFEKDETRIWHDPDALCPT